MKNIMIEIDDERIGQYSARKGALLAARLEAISTGNNHKVKIANTWRRMEPLKCYTIILK
jgi:hypothetical protein